MRAVIDTDTGLLAVSSPATGGKRVFHSIQGSFAWGDPTALDEAHRQHAIILAGDAEDGTIVVLREDVNNWGALVDKAITLKDSFLAHRWHAPEHPPELIQELRHLEGFSRYEVIGRSAEHVIYKTQNPHARWEHFRNYGHTATVFPWSADVEAGLTAIQVHIKEAMLSGQVTQLHAYTPVLDGIIAKEARDAMKLAAYQAFLALCWILLKEQQHRGRPQSGRPRRTWHWADPQKG